MNFVQVPVAPDLTPLRRRVRHFSFPATAKRANVYFGSLFLCLAAIVMPRSGCSIRAQEIFRSAQNDDGRLYLVSRTAYRSEIRNRESALGNQK
jgi:hypothetical protein